MPLGSLPPRVRALVLPLATAIVVAWPLFAFRYPPMTDFASHEALVWLLRHRQDASLYPPGLYVLNLGHPNQLAYAAAWLLSFAFGVHAALKIVVALAIAAILHAASRLARHLEATPWSVLLVAPVAVGFTFYVGFVPNLLGIAVFLYALPSIDRFTIAPDLRGAVRAASWVVLLYFAHESLLFVLLGAIGLFALVRGPTRRAIAFEAIPIFLGAVIVVVQARLQEPLRSRASRLMVDDFGPIQGKITSLGHVAFGGFDGATHAILLVLIVLAIGFMWRATPRAAVPVTPPSATKKKKKRKIEKKPAVSLRDRLTRHRFVLLGLCCVVLYFAMPWRMNGASLVNTRYLPIAIAILVVALAPASADLLGKIVAACVPLLVLVTLVPQCTLADRFHAELDAIEAHIENDSAIANIDMSGPAPDVAFRPGEFAARILEDRGGRLMNSFVDSPIAPAILAPPYRWDETLARSNFQPLLFRPGIDLRRFRYLLLRASSDRAQMITGAIGPEGRLVAESGEFHLYESTLPLMPTTSPEFPSPPPTATLLSRLRERFHVGLEPFDVRIDDLVPLPQ